MFASTPRRVLTQSQDQWQASNSRLKRAGPLDSLEIDGKVEEEDVKSSRNATARM